MAEVYVITNKVNGKQYVGKTNRTTEIRFKEHLKESVKPRSENIPLYRAMNKYGEDNFSLEIVEKNLTPDEANALEVEYIKKLETFGNGYNATIGGDGTTYVLVTEEEVSEIIELYKSGMTLKDIAIRFNCDRSTVTSRIKGSGIKVSKGGYTKWHGPISVTHSEFGNIHFNEGQDFVDFIIKKGLTSATEASIKASIGRIANGSRKSYLGFKID